MSDDTRKPSGDDPAVPDADASEVDPTPTSTSADHDAVEPTDEPETSDAVESDDSEVDDGESDDSEVDDSDSDDSDDDDEVVAEPAVSETTTASSAATAGSVGRWLRRVLGRKAFELPDANPPVPVTHSTTPDRVEAPTEPDDWDDEWDAPVVTDDPWTPPTVDKARWLRWSSDRSRTWIGLGFVTVFVLALYLPFIGSFGLWDPWETHYGEVSRHMTETGDWISPWWGSHWHRPDANAEGAGFFSKPILLLWSMALGLEVWGWAETGIRVGVALMASLAVCLTYMAGASVWNRRTGFLMAGVMATSPFFFFVGRQAQTDMPFVAMMTCAMALFMMGAFGKDRRKPADAVHYGLFFATVLALVLPQLWLIATDSGFSEAQRALRPGLRANSMLDFKGEQVLEEVVHANTPHLSPTERDALAELPPPEADAAIAAATGTGGDWTWEMTAPYMAVGYGLLAIIALLFFGLRGRLGAVLMRDKTNRYTVLALVAMALLAQALALGLQVKRLYGAWGANWEGQFGTAFNLVKFSGIGLALVMLVCTAALVPVALRIWRDEDKLAAGTAPLPDPDKLRQRRLIFLALVGLVVAALFVSPVLLVLKSKALGLDGLSFWDAEAFPAGRLIKILLGSVYAPLVMGLFVLTALIVFFSARARWWEGRNPMALWTALVLLASTIFVCVSVFYIPISVDGQLSTFGKVAGKVVSALFQWGPVQVALYVACLVIVAISLYTSKRKTTGQLCFMGFYIFAALATLAKGLLGFALPGAIIFFYLIATVEWKRLLEFEVPRGLLVFIAVGVPWYAAMLILHEKAYWDRFFVHDHFKRLASGVHAIDDGTFEHFIRWLAYGLFPWTALVPAALVRLGSGRGLLRRDDRSRATLIIAIWGTFAFTLFSLSSTKFHHYTFPVVPALCMLVALLLSELWSGRMKRMGPLLLTALPILVLVGWDLADDPELWKNLFTYKYDRLWIALVPEFTANIFGEPTVLHGAELHRSFQNVAIAITALAGLGLVLILLRDRWVRRGGVAVLLGAATLLTVWGLDVYMPAISPTWSQRGMWMAYWEDCTKIDAPPDADPKKIWCEESSLVYRITWRGEHYYSQNESIPLQSDEDMAWFTEYNGDTPFYIMVDRARYCGGNDTSPNFGDDCTGTGAIVGEVKKHYKGKPVDSELAWDENLKFVMVKFYPAGKDPQPPEEPKPPPRNLTPTLKRPPEVSPAPVQPGSPAGTVTTPAEAARPAPGEQTAPAGRPAPAPTVGAPRGVVPPAPNGPPTESAPTEPTEPPEAPATPEETPHESPREETPP